jgi:hypothetical protein
MKIDKYTVTLGFINHIHGGIPILPEDLTEEERAAKYAPWIAKQAAGVPKDLQGDTDAEGLAADLAADDTMPLSDDTETACNGFRRVKGVPAIETRQVKAMLRESMQRLGFFLNNADGRMKQVIQHDLVVRALDNGDFLTFGVDDITGIEERPIHVMTAQGPRSSIAMNEYIDGEATGATITFMVKILRGGVAKEQTLNEERLRDCLEYAEEFSALGANRAQGFGRFIVKEVKCG